MLFPLDYFQEYFENYSIKWISKKSEEEDFNLKYFMVNKCGIEFNSEIDLEREADVTRDQIFCYEKSQNNSILQYFQNGSLSAKGARSIIFHSETFKEIHNQINISFDALFVVPKSVTDAVFKVYVDTESEWIYSTECAFFKNQENQYNCPKVNEQYHFIKFLHLEESIKNQCDEISFTFEFVTQWSDQDKLLRVNNEPYMFLTNLTFNLANIQNVNNNNCSKGCLDEKCFERKKVEYYLFSNQGIGNTNRTISEQVKNIYQIYSRKCCQCNLNYTKIKNFCKNKFMSYQITYQTSNNFSEEKYQLTLSNKSDVQTFQFIIDCNDLNQLLESNFEDIFSFFNQESNLSDYLNNMVVEQINYILNFTVDSEQNNTCYFNKDQIDILAQLQYIIVSLQNQSLIFQSGMDYPIKLKLIGTLRFIGFDKVIMNNIQIEISDEDQEDKIIAIIFKPMVLDATFQLTNITIVKGDQMRVVELKIVLEEFQGNLILNNILLSGITWQQKHSFIEFSQGNRFLDKMYEIKSYQPKKHLVYYLSISNFSIINCIMASSIQILIFPTSNIEGIIKNIAIINSKFIQSSSILSSFSCNEPKQLEMSSFKRELIIRNILLSNSSFYDDSIVIQIQLQKVMPTKSKLMNLSIQNFEVTNCQFYSSTVLIYNDHPFFNLFIDLITISQTNFFNESKVIFDQPERIITGEGIITISNTFIQNVNFFDESIILFLRNKNIKITLFKYEDSLKFEIPTNFENITPNFRIHFKSTLIKLENFQSYIVLSHITISNTVQFREMIIISDQIGNSRYSSKIEIIQCVISHILLISQNVQQAGSPLSIKSIRNQISIYVSNSDFINNIHESTIYQNDLTACLYILALNSQIFFNQIKLISNKGINSQTGIVIVDSNQLSILNSFFYNSSYLNEERKGIGGHLYALSRSILISNSNFKYSNSSHGGALYLVHYIASSNNTVFIKNSLFQLSTAHFQIRSGEGGAIQIEFIVDQSSENTETIAFLEFYQCQFIDNRAESGAGGIQLLPNVLTNVTLIILECTFQDNFGLKALHLDLTHNSKIGNDQQTVNWNLIIEQCSFIQQQMNLSYFQKYLNQSIDFETNTQLIELFTNIHFSASDTSMNHFSIISTKFIQVKYSSIFIAEVINFIIIQNVSIEETQTIYQPQFYLYLSDSVKIKNLSFKQNQRLMLNDFVDKNVLATSLFSNSLIILQNSQVIIIQDSNFSENYCNTCLNGLILIANISNLSVQNTIFKLNKIAYGGGILIKNISKFIQQFAIIQKIKTLIANSNLKDNRTFQIVVHLNNSIFQNNRAQNEGGAIFISLNQISKVKLLLNNISFINNYATHGSSIRVVGFTQNFEIFQSNVQSIPNVIEKLPYTDLQDQIFNNISAGCLEGTFYNNQQQFCQKCLDSKYTIEPNQFVCKDCPQSAQKCSGNEILLKHGFWRVSNRTDKIAECIYKELCVGGSAEYVCKEGYSGALCESCDLEGKIWRKSYTRTADRICIECSYQFFQIFRTTLVMLLVFISMTIAVNSTIKHITLEIIVKYLRYMKLFVGSRYRDAQFAAVYLKILAAHFIVVSLILNMELKIPQSLIGFFSGVGSPLDQLLFSQDCLIYNVKLPLPGIYFRIITSIIYPMIFYLAFVILKMCYKGINRRPMQKGTYTVSGLFIIVYMQPNLFEIVVGIISCKRILDKFYVIKDTNQECYTDTFNYYLYRLIIPLLLGVCFILPISMFTALFKNRGKLNTCEIRFRYGYLVLGYSQSPKKMIAKFWEIIVIYKKISTLALLNYFADSYYNQGLLMLFGLLIYLVFLRIFEPYDQVILNSADQQITMLQCYIMVFALLVQQNEKVEFLLWIGLAFLLILNIYAIYFLFKGVFQDFKQDFYFFMSKHYYNTKYQSCCPCFGKVFKQNKVAKGRIQKLWQKAFTQLMVLKKKFDSSGSEEEDDQEIHENEFPKEEINPKENLHQEEEVKISKLQEEVSQIEQKQEISENKIFKQTFHEIKYQEFEDEEQKEVPEDLEILQEYPIYRQITLQFESLPYVACIKKISDLIQNEYLQVRINNNRVPTTIRITCKKYVSSLVLQLSNGQEWIENNIEQFISKYYILENKNDEMFNLMSGKLQISSPKYEFEFHFLQCLTEFMYIHPSIFSPFSIGMWYPMTNKRNESKAKSIRFATKKFIFKQERLELFLDYVPMQIRNETYIIHFLVQNRYKCEISIKIEKQECQIIFKYLNGIYNTKTETLQEIAFSYLHYLKSFLIL